MALFSSVLTARGAWLAPLIAAVADELKTTGAALHRYYWSAPWRDASAAGARNEPAETAAFGGAEANR